MDPLMRHQVIAHLKDALSEECVCLVDLIVQSGMLANAAKEELEYRKSNGAIGVGLVWQKGNR